MDVKPHQMLRRFTLNSLVLLAVVLIGFPAAASMLKETRNWSVAGPGGYYGLVEDEYVTVSGQHVGWETWIACGPFHVALPCRMWTTIAVGVIFCGLVTGAILRSWRHETKTQRGVPEL